jgi:acyl-homoserine-lactone acylase
MKLRAVLAVIAVLSSLAADATHAAALQEPASAIQDSIPPIAARVEIVRTTYGVPHVFADDLEAMGYAMGWVQSEDYGDQVAIGMVKRRGTYARFVGRDSIGGDFTGRVAHAHAAASFGLLDSATQDVYRGFAEGVNQYVRLHAELFPDWLTPDFDGVDALANDVYTWSRADAAAFVRAESRRTAGRERGRGLEARPDLPRSWLAAERDHSDFDPAVDGSNAWALDGSRTTSGHAILLRNPHLSWNAGYYEAHVRVPGVVDFYGDFRIGGAFGIIGGFNRHLGWATTNNSPRYSQVYSLERHPTRANHVLLDGEAVSIEERTVVADYRNPDGTTGTEREVTAWTPWGPVIHESQSHVYVLTDPRVGQFRRGQQMLRMMTAETMEGWLEVMRMRAHASSNFTYADADGNIGLYYNARIPDLPHESTGDTAALARSATDMWSEVAAWESLPLYVNPPGGYVQQANDTPDYINLNVPLDRYTVAPNLPDPRLRLRSQLSFDLIHGDDRLSLEDVVERKHTPRMLAAERMLDDLLSALAATEPTPGLTESARVLEAWDRTARAESRGGVLFKAWFNTYLQVTDTLVYRQPWDSEHPASTPVGVGAPGRAVASMRMAIEDLRAEGIALDTRWGDLHRVVRGSVDAPVSGCEGGLGCFRTLSFASMEDGRRAANRGDGWIFAVEFGDEPRGYSVLAYGQSRLEDSPHYDDQAAMFARGEMKTILWSDADIGRSAIRRYRPGTR